MALGREVLGVLFCQIMPTWNEKQELDICHAGENKARRIALH